MVTVLPLKLLPQEVWLSIFSYLDGESLQLLMLTDSIIEHWLDEELFWFQKCQRALDTLNLYPKYKLDRGKTKSPWKDFYLHSISPYEYLLGCWQNITDDKEDWKGKLLKFSISPDVGMIHGYISVFEEDGGITFTSCISLHSDGEFSTQASVEPYPLGVIKHEILDKPVETCSSHRPSDDHSKYIPEIYTSEIVHIAGITNEPKKKISKRTRSKGTPDCSYAEDVSRWVKLRSLSDFSKEFIQPGVFKASYGDHGMELILLTHFAEDNVLLGTKLTGDSNVPCGKHSFVVALSKPLILDIDSQDSIQSLEEAEVSSRGTTQQPFVMPGDIWCDDPTAELRFTNLNTCLARYMGEATLAGDMYVNPEWSDIHWIKFNENEFAVMFMELHDIALLTRQADLLF